MALGAVAVAITVWAAVAIDFTLAPLWDYQGRGREILARFLNPDWAFALRVGPKWLETLSIAVIASVIGAAIALLGAQLTSSATNRSAPLRRGMRALFAVIRSLPDMGWGLLAVALVGAGSLAGILALIVFNAGIIAKLTGESLDAIDRGPLEAADAAGASAIQRARFAALPQIMPTFLSYSLYVFEMNVRASVILGLVGAGGIGSVIMVELGRFQYEHISSIVLATFVVVLLIDALSQSVRRSLV